MSKHRPVYFSSETNADGKVFKDDGVLGAVHHMGLHNIVGERTLLVGTFDMTP